MMTRSLSLSMLLTILAVTGPIAAQNAPAKASIVEKLDVDKAHVYVATLQPHTPSASPNGHATNRVLIYMDDGVITRREGTAPAETMTFHRGDVRWRRASGSYVAENTTNHVIRILEVDLRGRPSSAVPVTKLDPAQVDPKHYKVVFENEQVRVLRIHFEAHDKGAEHEHILNRVVFILNDQSNGKADDVRVAGAAVHTEQNQADTTADRIAVELK